MKRTLVQATGALSFGFGNRHSTQARFSKITTWKATNKLRMNIQMKRQHCVKLAVAGVMSMRVFHGCQNKYISLNFLQARPLEQVCMQYALAMARGSTLSGVQNHLRMSSSYVKTFCRPVLPFFYFFAPTFKMWVGSQGASSTYPTGQVPRMYCSTYWVGPATLCDVMMSRVVPLFRSLPFVGVLHMIACSQEGLIWTCEKLFSRKACLKGTQKELDLCHDLLVKACPKGVC